MSLLFVTLQTINFQIVRAHRLLLSACSPYFRRLLSGLTSSQHPIIILRWSSCQENADASSALFQRRKSFRLGGNFGVHLQWGSEHRTRLLAGLPCSCWDSPHSRPHWGGLPPLLIIIVLLLIAFFLHAGSQWLPRKPGVRSKYKVGSSIESVGGTSIGGSSCCWRLWDCWSWH